MASLREEMGDLIDRCYVKGSPDYPKLIVFQRQRFINEVFPLIIKRLEGIENPYESDDCYSDMVARGLHCGFSKAIQAMKKELEQ